MNTTHPDDMDEQVPTEEATQASDDPQPQARKSSPQAAPLMERSATNPVIINK